MRRLVACIPIKLNSERLKQKNIKAFYDGKVLMYFMQNSLLRSNKFDDIYVFCSDEKVKEYLLEGIKFLKRPKEFDLPEATPQDIIGSFMQLIDAEVYAFCHVTSPFIKVETICECVEKVMTTEYDSAFTVTKIQKLLWEDGRAHNFNPSCIPRTQDLMPLYAECSAIYIFDRSVFEMYKRRIGVNPYKKEIGVIEGIDIDTIEDFEIADAIYMKKEGKISG